MSSDLAVPLARGRPVKVAAAAEDGVFAVLLLDAQHGLLDPAFPLLLDFLLPKLPTELDLSELTRDITLPDSVDAPIAAGDELGEMTVSYNGTVYGTVKLLALSDVSASWLLVAKRDVADFFSRTAVRIVLVALVLLILAFLFLRGNGRGRRYGKRSSGRAAPAGYRGRRR